MNLSQIAVKLSLSQLDLNYAADTDGVKTEWLRHWDNDSRIAVSLHEDLYEELVADPTIDSLVIQSEERTAEASGQLYTALRIVKHAPAEKVLKLELPTVAQL